MSWRNLAPRSKNKKQAKRFLIVSEGAVTEIDYLNEIRRSRRIKSSQIKIVPPGPTSPLQIVQKAVQLRDLEKRSDPYDEVWCVFDAESTAQQTARPGLIEAAGLANSKRISLALSNPCFELWLLLHEEDCRAYLFSNVAQGRCRALGLIQEKAIRDVKTLNLRYEDARQRAIDLEETHNQNQVIDVRVRNPSSLVYALVDALHGAFPAP